MTHVSCQMLDSRGPERKIPRKIQAEPKKIPSRLKHHSSCSVQHSYMKSDTACSQTENSTDVPNEHLTYSRSAARHLTARIPKGKFQGKSKQNQRKIQAHCKQLSGCSIQQCYMISDNIYSQTGIAYNCIDMPDEHLT